MKHYRLLSTVPALAVCLTLSLPVPASSPLAKGHAHKKKEKAPDTSPVGRYPTVEMHGSKRGADASSGVIYLNASQREERRISIRDGLVYDHLGKPLLNTKGKHHNLNNYVMDAAGNFYLFDEFTTPSIRHSSIFAGGPVAGAGNIQITNGRVVYIDSDSGHYPSKSVFANVLRELAARGVNVAGLAKY